MSHHPSEELAGFRAFKEILLLLRFIYRSICATKQGCEQRRGFCNRLLHELRLVQSFGRCFLQVDGRMDNRIQGEPWFKHVGEEFGRLRKHFGDYAALALIRDGQYQKFSPYWSLSEERELGFPRDFDQLQDTPVGKLVEVIDEKLGVWEDRRLEKLLRRTRVCTNSILLWVPLIVAKYPRYRDLSGEQGSISEEDAFRLNLDSHLRLRNIAKGCVPDGRMIMLRDFELHGPIESSGLTEGKIANIDSGEIEPVLFEYKRHRRSNDPDRPIRGEFELIQLSYLLAEVSLKSPEMHTLGFKGIIDQSATSRRFAFIFNYPKYADRTQPPISLHSAMTNPTLTNSVWLPIRFQIAQILCKTIAKFHTDGWVHKNLSSHSIVFFTDSSSMSNGPESATTPPCPLPTPSYEKPYLVDFEYARPVGADTEYASDPDFERNLYRHPKRQGLPSEAFIKMHDIYALGVVLLEIGLWIPASQIYSAMCPGPQPLKDEEILDPWTLQTAFLKAAKEKLPNQMGYAYADAVVACLGDYFREFSFQEELGAVFVEKVVSNLEISKLQVGSEI